MDDVERDLRITWFLQVNQSVINVMEASRKVGLTKITFSTKVN